MKTPPPKFDSRAKTAFVVACAALLLGGLGFQGAVKALNLYLKKEPVALRMPLSLISGTLGRWKAVGPDRVMDPATVETLGTSMYLNRTYAIDGKPSEASLQVHLAYYTGMIDTVPHVPDRCMVAAGLDAKTLPENILLAMDESELKPDPEGVKNLSTDQVYRVAYHRDLMGQMVAVRMPVGDLKLRTIEFGFEKSPGTKIFGGYFFIANGRATPTPEGVKLLSFDPSEKYAYYCKVQYVYDSPKGTQEKFLELVADHLKNLLPELMRCLPDWAEVERRDAPVSEKLTTKQE